VIGQVAHQLVGVSALLFAALVPALDAKAAPLSCTQAAEEAESGVGLPRGLLLAVGSVESGRLSGAGRRVPWPWTIRAAGVGRFFSTVEDTVSAVVTLRAAGIQSIDIGCFQINLHHHPNIFFDLYSGFDPLTNAFAAARFLAALHQEFGAWGPAIAAYHSRSEWLGAPYLEAVLASWHGARSNMTAIAGVHVWGPGGEFGLGRSGPPYVQVVIDYKQLVPHTSSHLPRVVTLSVR
jgi:hypothetical protein